VNDQPLYALTEMTGPEASSTRTVVVGVAEFPWRVLVILIIAFVTGLLPTKGMSLPFISAGGSNLLLMGLLVGIIINSQRTWERPKPLQRKRSLTEVIG